MRTMTRQQRGGLVCLCLALACLAWCVPPAGAATRTVTTTTDRDNGSYTPGNASLREAVKYANSGDTVEFGVNGTFTLTLGEIVINKTLTIQGNNQSVLDSNTTVSGGASSRVFNITGGAVTIKNLIVTQGYTDLDPGGGGISNLGTLTLDTVRVTNCTADYRNGGGVLSLGDLTLLNCYISGNQVLGLWSGGGVCVYSTGATNPTAIFTDTYFGSNDCGGPGGGLALDYSDSSITRCTFYNNTSTSSGNGGGGLNQWGGACTITDSTFDSNQCTRSGGAISSATVPDLTIVGCTFTDNACEFSGGAIIFTGGNLEVLNSTFYGNDAGMDGGALALNSTNDKVMKISFSTITFNYADADCGLGGTCDNGDGGGVRLSSGVLYLRGVILASNFDRSSGSSDEPDCAAPSGILSTQSYNLIGVNTGCSLSFPAGLPNLYHDYVGTSASNLNPGLFPLADNGGPTETCRPTEASVALNHGPPDCTEVSGNPVATDQRGLGRNRGGCPDIGAYETPAGSGAPLAVLLD